MNNRIRELAEQAGFNAFTQFVMPKHQSHISDELEKFAELIIKECLELRSNMSSLRAIEDIEFGSADMVIVADAAFDQYYDAISEHFGIKE